MIKQFLALVFESKHTPAELQHYKYEELRHIP